MKKIAILLIIFITIASIVIYRNNAMKNEKTPVAGIFNHYIAQLAEANKECITLESKFHSTFRGKSIDEKNALLDQYIQQLEIAKGKVQSIQAPEELADLKPLYLNMYDYLVESTQFQKKQLTQANTQSDGEEEELVTSKGLTAYGKLDSFINSLQVGYGVKCLNKPAAMSLEKVKGNKYFVDN